MSLPEWMDLFFIFFFSFWPWAKGFKTSIHLFRERLSAKICTRQSRKVTWDIINTPFLTLQLSNLRLLLSFSSSQTYVHGLSCHSFNFFEEEWTQNHPQYLSGLSRALFPTTFLEIAVCIMKKLWNRQMQVFSRLIMVIFGMKVT